MIDTYLTAEQKAARAAAQAEQEKARRLRFFRDRRNQMLAECDWTQLPDAALSPEKKAAWSAYRQALRDVPETANAAGWVTWPKKPTP